MDSSQLDRQIDRLESQSASLDSRRPDWKGVWSLIKEISGEFKSIRYPTREERTVAWNRFQGIVAEVKSRQDRYFQDQKSFSEESAKHLEKLKRLADLALPDSGLADMIVFLATGGLSFLAKEALDALLGKLDEEHMALQKRSDAMRRAWDYLTTNKAHIKSADKSAAYERLNSVKAKLDADWQSWKNRKQEVYDARNRERDAKREAWRTNQRDYINRLEGALHKLESAYDRRKEHLSELMEKYASARSDEYRSRVESWIDEERSSIRDIDEKLSDVRSKLSEARARLNG